MDCACARINRDEETNLCQRGVFHSNYCQTECDFSNSIFIECGGHSDRSSQEKSSHVSFGRQPRSMSSLKPESTLEKNVPLRDTKKEAWSHLDALIACCSVESSVATIGFLRLRFLPNPACLPALWVCGCPVTHHLQSGNE